MSSSNIIKHINRTIAEHRNMSVNTDSNSNDVFATKVRKMDNVINVTTCYDPCRNPADASEIIIENSISIKFRGNKVIAEKDIYRCELDGRENYTLAAMIVYLDIIGKQIVGGDNNGAA